MFSCSSRSPLCITGCKYLKWWWDKLKEGQDFLNSGEGGCAHRLYSCHTRNLFKPVFDVNSSNYISFLHVFLIFKMLFQLVFNLISAPWNIFLFLSLPTIYSSPLPPLPCFPVLAHIGCICWSSPSYSSAIQFFLFLDPSPSKIGTACIGHQ